MSIVSSLPVLMKYFGFGDCWRYERKSITSAPALTARLDNSSIISDIETLISDTKNNEKFGSINKIHTDEEKDIILKCLKEIKSDSGRSLLYAVLKGSRSNKIFRKDMYDGSEVNRVKGSEFRGPGVASCGCQKAGDREQKTEDRDQETADRD